MATKESAPESLCRWLCSAHSADGILFDGNCDFLVTLMTMLLLLRTSTYAHFDASRVAYLILKDSLKDMTWSNTDTTRKQRAQNHDVPLYGSNLQRCPSLAISSQGIRTCVDQHCRDRCMVDGGLSTCSACM